jgi:DNA-binding PadR family transcriptional regulator
MLGELEQLVLLAVLRTDGEAYGVPIRAALVDRAGRDVTLGSVYNALARLEEKGLVTSAVGEPTAERGGRRKRLYAATTAGRAAARDTVGALRAMARGLDLGLEGR